MQNIKLSYLYRDAGNYKQFGDIIFANPETLPLYEIEKQIKEKLIDGEFFSAKEWNLPTLYAYPKDRELDHTWHEFESVDYSEEKPIMKISIQTFLNNL